MPTRTRGEGTHTVAYQNQGRRYSYCCLPEPGEKVLVLLPTRTEKILTKWKGPYSVLRQVGKVTYELEMEGARNGKKIIHINMLKKWKEGPEKFLNLITDEHEEIPCYEDKLQDIQDAEFGNQLTKKQKR